MKRVSIDPITRIEGHLKIELDIDSDRVKSARSSGTLFRGLEEMLRGRDPRDAQRVTQRVCGVCPAAHAIASAQALDDAYGIRGEVPPNGRLERNLMLGGNFIHSHVLHFYHLSALDYLNPHDLEDLQLEDVKIRDLQSYLKSSDGAPFTPEYSGDYRLGNEISAALAGDYLDALEVRKKAHQMVSIFGGKMPHNMGTISGGATRRPDIDSITKFTSRLEEIKEFLEDRYLPGVIEVAKTYKDYFKIGKGVSNFLEYGGFYLKRFEGSHHNTSKGLEGGIAVEGESSVREVELDRITEAIEHSWYDAEARGHPTATRSVPAVDKEGGYSWVKAPRYKGKPHEVGPAARMKINYLKGNDLVERELGTAMEKAGIGIDQLNSVMGRHLCRAVECKCIVNMMEGWVEDLVPGDPSCSRYEVPEEGKGVGLASAPRGTLGHWIKIENGQISNYQLVVPTTWNASPRDEQGTPGPMEQALMGEEIDDPDNPLEAARIVRSFDPCMACAVH
ncbi:MAG: nickel-dependent hydrogenase large subunit [Candidatus Bipolaricaulota bacterium]|nr:nickel-dependent hydrogenase large subunit [Candidatus Bipolaricaulota bacterium]